MLWRRTVWQQAGEYIRDVAGDPGTIRPLWFGYAVERGSSTVKWRGGVMGAATVVVGANGHKQRTAGWLTAAELQLPDSSA